MYIVKKLLLCWMHILFNLYHFFLLIVLHFHIFVACCTTAIIFLPVCCKHVVLCHGFNAPYVICSVSAKGKKKEKLHVRTET